MSDIIFDENSHEQTQVTNAAGLCSNGSSMNPMSQEIEQSIPERFEKMVAALPERVAIKTRLRQCTYAQLNCLANRIAYALLSRSEKQGEPVALLLDDEEFLIAAMIGVLKAGKGFVFLDRSIPLSRVDNILQDAQPNVLVTNIKRLPMAQALVGQALPLMNLDELDGNLPSENPGLTPSPASLTCILYNFSSIHQPIGVFHNHRSILHSARNYANELCITFRDRLASLFSWSTHEALEDVFGALLNGASLHFFNLQDEGLARMTQWLRRKRITVYSSTPMVFRAFAETWTAAEELSDLRLIKLSGDLVNKRDFDAFRNRLPRSCSLISTFGSTETGIICWNSADAEAETDDADLSVGTPVEGKEILLLDDTGHEVKRGETGEIAVKSRYLAQGYWQHSDLTRAVFSSDGSEKRIHRTGDIGRMMPDGRLSWVGRKDALTTLESHRIDVKVIELALQGLESVQAAVVTVHKSLQGPPRLVAYFTSVGDAAPTASRLRQALRGILPDYLIPSRFVRLDAFPLGTNGKLNSCVLPFPISSRPELETPFVIPRTAMEQKLAHIWGQVLALDQIGVEDDFFELGGDSLSAIKLVYEIYKTFHLKIPYRALFESSTISGMATVIAKQQKNSLDADNQKRILTKLLILLRKETAKQSAPRGEP